MECVILVRMVNGSVIALGGDDIAVFKNTDEAVEQAEGHILCQNFPYQIIELNEL